MKKILFLIVLMFPTSCFAITKTVVDIDGMNIVELQECVDKGYLTYVELTSYYLDRIDAYNTQYNALNTINEDALDIAKYLDKEYEESGRRSLLHGIPLIVKDNIDVYGLPTTIGIKALLDSYPNSDSDVVKSLRDAGAIIIAKSNMFEFAFSASSSYSSFGHVKNAWNLEYSSYGSSGGSAVGVAANLAVAAIGTDTGTSIRVPSSVNGVFGLRPTHDLIPQSGIVKYDAVRDVAGPITKSVVDSAIILSIIDNTDREFEYDSVSNLKVAVFEDLVNSSEPYIKELFNKQIDYLKSIGVSITYVDSFTLEHQFNENSICYDFNEYIKNTSSEIKNFDDLINSRGKTQNYRVYDRYCDTDFRDTSEYKEYLEYKERVTNEALDNFKDFDLFLYPTVRNEVMKLSNLNLGVGGNSRIAPITGFPAMSVPMGFNEGIPYGLEILAKSGEESKIFKIAYALEKFNGVVDTPLIAPSLYEVPEYVSELLELYESKNGMFYKDVKSLTEVYIKNYNNFDSKDRAIELIEMYKAVPANSVNFYMYFLVILVVCLILLISFIKWYRVLKFSKIEVVVTPVNVIKVNKNNKKRKRVKRKKR